MSALAGGEDVSMQRSVEMYARAAVERAMKTQEVILRAMAKKITWWQAAEILGICDRQMPLRRLSVVSLMEQSVRNGAIDLAGTQVGTRSRCSPEVKRDSANAYDKDASCENTIAISSTKNKRCHRGSARQAFKIIEAEEVAGRPRRSRPILPFSPSPASSSQAQAEALTDWLENETF